MYGTLRKTEETGALCISSFYDISHFAENIVKLFKHFMIVYHVSLSVSQSVENHQLFSLRFGWLLHFIPSMLAQIHLAINITDYEAQSAKPRSKTSYHQVLQSRGMGLCLVMFYIIML